MSTIYRAKKYAFGRFISIEEANIMERDLKAAFDKVEILINDLKRENEELKKSLKSLEDQVIGNG